ncbi:universal stress protein [Saccharopolyspora sp. HNM0983]|uniref:Universal stress protein n=1 Tax=Saccharopolyspora montiporae TaxID=2781240 RepID=A0A929B838_9PSEU|nr:universal stress protein [Saccharopolyspora sp. HNM0983]MBE9373555.1 universal stress protein [Saccharopolyspora sp. HNM0983]
MATTHLVGIDGSETALNALTWAAHDAVLHEATLHLISVATQPDLARNTRWLQQAQQIATDAGANTETRITRGKPATELIEASTGAERITVGNRGLADNTGTHLPLGSTAETVAMRAHCPAAVIPSTSRPDPTAPVIVGVDGSALSDPALRTAFDEASARGVGLIAVHVYSDTAVDEVWGQIEDWYELRQREEEVLAERLAGWHEQYPDVSVQRVVERDRPVRYLANHAATAQLIVVGSRGRGGMTGMLLGSTSRALLHIAPCPVLVVRLQHESPAGQ